MRPVRPEIPPLLRDHLLLSLPLQLVLFYFSVLINLIHKLMHTSNRLTYQRFPQTMLGWKARLKSTNGHIVKVPIYFIKHLPISSRVSLQTLPFSHGQRYPATCDEVSTKSPSEFLEGIDRVRP